jgi:outer membrane protein OmpA-like peptidoglycan-associated protein
MFRFLLLSSLSLFNIAGWAAGITLDKQDASFVPGEPIQLAFFGGNDMQPGAWVGIFKQGYKSNTEHYSYQYLKGDTGTLIFSTPKEHGEYKFVLYGSGYEGKEHAHVNFTVSAGNTDAASLTLDRATYKPAKPIKVNLKLLKKLSNKAWLGVFPKNAPHGLTGNYLSYKYLHEGEQESYIFAAPEPPGDYDIRLFDDENGFELTYAPFKVTAIDNKNLSLTTDKVKFAPEETVKVHFIADKDFPRDAWVGLYKGNEKEATSRTEKYLDFRYIENKIESDMAFKAPSMKGDYHFKMVSSYNGTVVAMTGITVDRSMDAAFLKEKIDRDGRAVLYGIYFDRDKSDIKPSSHATLKVVGELLEKHPDIALQIEGHTDSRGEPGYNKQLSEKRAKAVKDYLIESFTVATNRLKTIGYGEEKPLNSNSSEAELALNRRVEIVRITTDNSIAPVVSLSGDYAVDLTVFKNELERSIAKSMPKYRFHEDMSVEIIVNGSSAYEGEYVIDEDERSQLIIKFEGKTLEAKLSKDQREFYVIEGEQVPFVKQ